MARLAPALKCSGSPKASFESFDHPTPAVPPPFPRLALLPRLPDAKKTRLKHHHSTLSLSLRPAVKLHHTQSKTRTVPWQGACSFTATCTCARIHRALTLTPLEHTRARLKLVSGSRTYRSAPSVPDTLATSLQSQLDFVSIDGMDPTLANGMKVYYEREVPFELRSQDSGDDDPQEVGALEAIKVRIVVSSDMETGVSGSAAPGVVVELSSESNLFFHYTHEMDSVRFSDVAQTQKLMVDYGEYPNVLLRMLNHCIKEPHTHLAVFVMKNDGKARLDFIQVRCACHTTGSLLFNVHCHSQNDSKLTRRTWSTSSSSCSRSSLLQATRRRCANRSRTGTTM